MQLEAIRLLLEATANQLHNLDNNTDLTPQEKGKKLANIHQRVEDIWNQFNSLSQDPYFDFLLIEYSKISNKTEQMIGINNEAILKSMLT